jgi:hypothetical protein
VRLLGAALVVNFDSAVALGASPIAPFTPEIRNIPKDYQSGSERPHSKGCRHFEWLIVFNFD